MSMTSETQLVSKLLALAKVLVQSASLMDFDEDEEENEKMSSEESDDDEDETSLEEEETEEEREEKFKELAEESTGLDPASPRKSRGSSMKSRWDVFKKEEELSPAKEGAVGLSPEMSKLIDDMFSSHIHKNAAAKLIKTYKPKNLKQAKELLEFSKESILKKKPSKLEKKFTPETDVQRMRVKREFKGPSSGGPEVSEIGFRHESWESSHDIDDLESLADRINRVFDTSFDLNHMQLLGEGDFEDIEKLLDAVDMISSRDMSTPELLGFLNALLELEHKKEQFSEQMGEEEDLGKPKKKEYKGVKVSLPKSVMKTIKEESGKAIETLQKKTKNRIFNTDLFESLRDFVNSANKAIAVSDMSSLFSLLHVSSSERASYDTDSLMDLLHTKLSSDFKKATEDYIKQMFKRKVSEIKEQPKPRKAFSNAEIVARLLLASRLI